MKLRYLILGRQCLFCGKTVDPRDEFCKSCAREAKEAQVTDHRGGPVSLYYGIGAVHQGLHRFKYRTCAEFGFACGKKLARIFAKRGEHAHLVTCVPRAKDGLPRRYNQSDVLAKAFARTAGLPYDGRLLGKRRGARTQVECRTVKEREANAKKSFCMGKSKRDLQGLRVVLVDDLYTTGATARACAELLRKRGASEVLIYTAARAVLRPSWRLVRSAKTTVAGDLSPATQIRFRLSPQGKQVVEGKLRP